MSLLDLEPEICIRILCDISLQDLAACHLTHSSLHLLITNSVQLQYRLATLIAGVEDNENSQINLDGRLAQLRSQEKSWSSFEFKLLHKISEESDFHWTIRGLAARMLWVADHSRSIFAIL